MNPQTIEYVAVSPDLLPAARTLCRDVFKDETDQHIIVLAPELKNEWFVVYREDKRIGAVK